MARSRQGRFPSQVAAFGITLVFVCITSNASLSLYEEQSVKKAHKRIQKRALLSEEVELVEVCTSVQSFEQLDTAVNVDLQTVQIHPEAWVFSTRCRVPGKACKGFDENLRSLCRPKKSWVQVYARAGGDTWRQHWVAIDTACVCSIRKNRKLLPIDRFTLTEKYLNE